MPERPTYQQFMNYNYSELGGYKAASQIFAAKLPYEKKLLEYKRTFQVSTPTAQRHHAQFRKMIGLNQ